MIVSESNIRKVVRQTLLEFEMGGITMGDFGSKNSHDDGAAGNMKLAVDGGEYNINVKQGVFDNVQKLDYKAKKAIVKMFKFYHSLNDNSTELPVITSGHRSAAEQYSAMFNNWSKKEIGGETDTDKKNYLQNLYGKSGVAGFVQKMHDFFIRARDEKNDTAKSEAIKWLSTGTNNPSKHGYGMAFDLRLTRGIEGFLDKFEKKGLIKKPYREADHYHITVKS